MEWGAKVYLGASSLLRHPLGRRAGGRAARELLPPRHVAPHLQQRQAAVHVALRELRVLAGAQCAAARAAQRLAGLGQRGAQRAMLAVDRRHALRSCSVQDKAQQVKDVQESVVGATVAHHGRRQDARARQQLQCALQRGARRDADDRRGRARGQVALQSPGGQQLPGRGRRHPQTTMVGRDCLGQGKPISGVPHVPRDVGRCPSAALSRLAVVIVVVSVRDKRVGASSRYGIRPVPYDGWPSPLLPGAPDGLEGPKHG